MTLRAERTQTKDVSAVLVLFALHMCPIQKHSDLHAVAYEQQWLYTVENDLSNFKSDATKRSNDDTVCMLGARGQMPVDHTPTHTSYTVHVYIARGAF